jgi:hypothetical protein
MRAQCLPRGVQSGSVGSDDLDGRGRADCTEKDCQPKAPKVRLLLEKTDPAGVECSIVGSLGLYLGKFGLGVEVVRVQFAVVHALDDGVGFFAATVKAEPSRRLWNDGQQCQAEQREDEAEDQRQSPAAPKLASARRTIKNLREGGVPVEETDSDPV